MIKMQLIGLTLTTADRENTPDHQGIKAYKDRSVKTLLKQAQAVSTLIIKKKNAFHQAPHRNLRNIILYSRCLTSAEWRRESVRPLRLASLLFLIRFDIHKNSFSRFGDASGNVEVFGRASGGSGDANRGQGQSQGSRPNPKRGLTIEIPPAPAPAPTPAQRYPGELHVNLDSGGVKTPRTPPATNSDIYPGIVTLKEPLPYKKDYRPPTPSSPSPPATPKKA